MERPGRHHCCLVLRPSSLHGWLVCGKPGIPGGCRGLISCTFCEVPVEESQRYLVLHAGCPDEAELLGPFSRALEKVRVDGVDRNVGLCQGAGSKKDMYIGTPSIYSLFLILNSGD